MTTGRTATEGNAEPGRGRKRRQGNNSQHFFFVFFFGGGGVSPPNLVRLLVGEEAGEGLSQAADGLGFGLVVGLVPSQRLCEGVGQRLRFAAW